MDRLSNCMVVSSGFIRSGCCSFLHTGAYRTVDNFRLGCNRLCVNPFGHEVVTFIAERADDLGGQRLVEELDDHIRVASISLGYRSLLDVLARALAQSLDVGEERPVWIGEQGGFGLCSRAGSGLREVHKRWYRRAG